MYYHNHMEFNGLLFLLYMLFILGPFLAYVLELRWRIKRRRETLGLVTSSHGALKDEVSGPPISARPWPQGLSFPGRARLPRAKHLEAP